MKVAYRWTADGDPEPCEASHAVFSGDSCCRCGRPIDGTGFLLAAADGDRYRLHDVCAHEACGGLAPYRRYVNGRPHPPIRSEYDVPDSGGVPETFYIDPQDCLELSNELLDIAWYRCMDESEIAEEAGMGVRDVEDLVRKGKGSEEGLFAVCRALGIELYGFPSEEELKEGVSWRPAGR